MLSDEAELNRSASRPGEETEEAPGTTEVVGSGKKPLRFWLVFVGTGTSTFLAALELSSVGTALPTIVHSLQSNEFVWVGSAYALASAASMPPSGGLSNIFGRQPIMLGSIGLFAVGAAIAGAAQTMDMLIAGRAIQGVGGGGILTLTEIIIADMVPLRERGKYTAISGGVWAVASVLGPPVGGAFASSGRWRWLFYMNIPLSLLAGTLVYFCLNLRQPEEHWMAKLRRIDWIGNALIISATASVILALTWGGVTYSWTSGRVLSPLIVGLLGMVIFMIYEAILERSNVMDQYSDEPVSEPTVPTRLMTNRTSLSGFLMNFVHGITSTLVVYYLPTFYQGAQETSAIRSGVLLLPLACLIAPCAVVVGRTVEATGKYMPQNYIAWPLCMLAFGLMALLKASSSVAEGVGLQIVLALSLSPLYITPQYSVLAPLSVKDNASALALMTWFRQFGQTFGITFGVTILQNGLKQYLPASLLAMYPTSAEISYDLIPQIRSFAEPLGGQVRKAFADSVRNIWWTGLGLSALGLFIAFFSKALALSLVTDEQWDINHPGQKRPGDVELAAVPPAAVVPSARASPVGSARASPRAVAGDEIEEVGEEKDGAASEKEAVAGASGSVGKLTRAGDA